MFDHTALIELKLNSKHSGEWLLRVKTKTVDKMFVDDVSQTTMSRGDQAKKFTTVRGPGEVCSSYQNVFS